jgi:Phenylpropionate dioxygenase and related ring-hydroxylating dioxygenases, large terminal subunit
MIFNQYYAVLSSREVRKKHLYGVTRLGRKLVFFRTKEGKVACIEDRCCHRGASLCTGKLLNGRVQCPFHGFEYDPDGKVALIPANGKKSPVTSNFKVRSYVCKEKGGLIFVWYGDNEKAPEEVPFFDELLRGFHYAESKEVWSVHYTRAIENQLDVVHLPFVHRTTIGRGGKAIVNGPLMRWNDNRMTYYVDDVLDQGQRPLKADEVPNFDQKYSLQLQMPNLWQNRIAPKIRVMAAFAPIDDEHTMIYIRFYQNVLPTPILGGMMVHLGNVADRVILHQDRRVVLTQLPKKSELQMNENLIQGDAPIIAYRLKRDALKKANPDS